MDLRCKRCRTLIPADDVNVGTGIAKCRACNAVFGFADQLAPAPRDRERAAAAMPPAITVGREAGALEITRRWFSPGYLPLLFFCIAWDAFLVFWYMQAPAAGWIFVIFPIGHVAVGVGLSYYTVAGLLNRTVVRVGRGQLTVRHGPVPWRGNWTLSTTELRQLYSVEQPPRSRKGVPTYTVQAILASGRTLPLLGGLRDTGQALYIEQAFERHLGIADRLVGVELPR